MADRFRTVLSLLGVCIGIFAIVAVLTLVDSLHSTISEGFENFGTDILFVESQPLEPDLNEDGVFRWWDYVSRPPVRHSEYTFLNRHLPDARVAFVSKASDNVTGLYGDWELLVRNRLSSGRAITRREMESGARVAMLGAKAAEELFPDIQNPLDRSIRLLGGQFRVVGIFEESGADMVSTIKIDESKLVSAKALESLIPESACSGSIAVAGADRETLRLLMRQVRRMRPANRDNFAINTLSFVVDQLADIFELVSTLGWIVGIFSLLVGGFGIANIMFVGVEERTPQIGIQKALGAHRRTIVKEYLLEAIALSVSGGIVGVALVWLATLIIPSTVITIKLTAFNALLGLGVSTLLGLLSGVAPAVRAAHLSPLAAINHE